MSPRRPRHDSCKKFHLRLPVSSLPAQRLGHRSLSEPKSSAPEEKWSPGGCCIAAVSEPRKRRERGEGGRIWKEVNEGGKRDDDFVTSDSGENLVF